MDRILAAVQGASPDAVVEAALTAAGEADFVARLGSAADAETARPRRTK